MASMIPGPSGPTIAKPPPRGLDTIASQTAVSGLQVIEHGGNGTIHTTEFIFTAMQISLADSNGANVGGQKIYDFPQGSLKIHDGSFYGAFTTTSAIASTLNSGVTVQFGFGTITAAATSNIMSAGCYNVLPGCPLAVASSATPAAAVVTLPTFTSSTTINVASAAVSAFVAQHTDITALTDSTGRTGTTDSTIANHADLSTYANDAAVIEQNISDLAQKINELVAAVNAGGASIRPLDGTVTAKDLYFNLNVATDTDIDAAATVTVTGTLILRWSVSGGYDYPNT